MTQVLKSGKNGNTVDVTDKNQLKVSSVSEAQSVDAAITGDSFLIVTPIITLTSANKSSLLWISNLDSLQWVISRTSFSFTASTDGIGEIVGEVLKNPTTGTLIDSGIVTQAENLNFGSPKVLASDIRTGVEGQTLTNGAQASQLLIPKDSSRTILSGEAVILSPGSQIGLSITPPAGNTSMKAHISLILHKVTP